MPVLQNAATGILVTAFSPDCRHFHLNISMFVNNFKALPTSFMFFILLFDLLVSYCEHFELIKKLLIFFLF